MLTADERGMGCRLRLPDATAGLQRTPGPDRLGLPLRFDIVMRCIRNGPLGGVHRRLVDDDGSHRSRGLEPRCRVHDVARHDALAPFGPGAQRDDSLARRHGSADRDLEPAVAQLLDRVEDPERGAHGTFGVVLVRNRRPEHGHHGVADELLDGASEALQIGLDPFVVCAQHGADVLRVGSVGPAREADEVDEEHGDDLPLLPDGSRSLERASTGKAEPRMSGVLLAAGGAGGHHCGSSQRVPYASTRPAARARPRPPPTGAGGRYGRARR